jgi:hypothetical protein
MFWVLSPQSDNNTHRPKQQHHQERYKETLEIFPKYKNIQNYTKYTNRTFCEATPI